MREIGELAEADANAFNREVRPLPVERIGSTPSYRPCCHVAPTSVVPPLTPCLPLVPLPSVPRVRSTESSRRSTTGRWLTGGCRRSSSLIAALKRTLPSSGRMWAPYAQPYCSPGR